MAKKLIPREDVRRAAGRLIICGVPGTTVTPEAREILREAQPAGVILFKENVESLEQLCELNRELKSLRPKEPLLSTVDQEGGRVARVRSPATEWPAMKQLGLLNDPQLVERVGAALAQELRALNFDVDYAPVLDVDTNPKNPVIGDRSFGDESDLVARMGAALIRGLQGGGVGACGKHFPGHGDTDKDSHHDLPFVEHELGRLREIEWPPFAAAIKAGVGAVMTAHVVVMPLDEDRPATLSPKVLSHLRQDLGFKGVVISDDLEMKAVADRYSVRELAVQGLNAGCDLFLACHDPKVILELYRAIVQAVEEQQVSHETLLAAEQRVLAWRERFFKAPTSWSKGKALVGPSAHGGLVEEIATRLERGL